MPFLKTFCLNPALLIIKVWILFLLPVSAAYAQVSVVTGPTAIPRGDANGSRDITVSNELFAVAFAVETAPPWGVARGGIVDIAIVKNDQPGYDIASLADFMPNRWSSWPTTYQQVTVEKNSNSEVIISTTRDWGEVKLVTRFTIKSGDSRIHLVTHMTNLGSTTLPDLMSGYVVWPDGGHLFGVPGLSEVYHGTETNALADWSAAYGENWMLGLHAPFSEFAHFGGRDRYLKHTLAAGKTATLEAWLQIEPDGTLAPLVQTEIDSGDMPFGQLSGRVTDTDGKPVARPAVVIQKTDHAYTWTIGETGIYAINLPIGKYNVFATASGYAQGAVKTISVSANQQIRLDFDDLRPPGKLHIAVTDQKTGQSLDARITIKSGYKQLISYFGKNTFFTALDTPGETTQTIAPGRYQLEIAAGAGFTSSPQLEEVEITPGQTHKLTTAINVMAMPGDHGWYSADLHHHSDVLDGFTEAEYVMRSELAAGVDIAFLSDHDSVVNNAEMQTLARTRGVHFIPGTELSPSWAHFNAYPLDVGKSVDIDTGQATVQELFAAARNMGADIIEVNHPYSGYGYFESLATTVVRDNITGNAVPGGYDSGFDLVEIEPFNHEANAKTLSRVWQMWNEGHKAYLAAGSDVHDVWIAQSGSARTYVHVDGDLTIDKFVAGLKAGHSYASQGPLVYPEILFGREVQLPIGDKLALNYTVQSVSGLHAVRLIERGKEIDAIISNGTDQLIPINFSVNPEAATWYSLVIEDSSGNFAYTNPVWVTTQDHKGKSILALILTIAIAVTMLTTLVLVTRWRNVRCTGETPVGLFVFVAILFTSGLDVGLIMFPLIDFQVYASEPEYSFANPLAIEFGFWGFLVWSFYFLTTFYFCIIEPKLRLFEIPVVKFINNMVTFGTCAFTAYLFLIYLPDYIQGISEPLRYGLVAMVILLATFSSTDIKFVKILSVSSTWLFFALIAGAWIASGMGVTRFAGVLSNIGAYFTNIQHFLSPITEYHQFYLYWWFAWSIMIGQFVARFASDLKAWKLLLALLIVPSIPIAIWFSVLYYYFSTGLDIGPFWRLAMVVVGVIFVINSLDSLIRLYTSNIGISVQSVGRLHYIIGNWLALSALVMLYRFTPLKIEWIGLVVIGIYIGIYFLVFQRRRQLVV